MRAKLDKVKKLLQELSSLSCQSVALELFGNYAFYLLVVLISIRDTFYHQMSDNRGYANGKVQLSVPALALKLTYLFSH